jgi:CubicO group peptidase (beta-lactamase class C family)
MARIGQLMLQGGRWNGRSVVGEDFVSAATVRQNAGGAPVGLPYGYLWWVAPSQAPRPAFVASGFGGQFIWVDPALDLVIAASSDTSAASAERSQALDLIRRHIVPALAASQTSMPPR